MVSDSLDVGEIFFNIDKFRDKIEIIVWDRKASINALKADGNPYHFYMADALDKYFVSDATTYNFDKLQNIYLLNYKAGSNELNIIGATSPATLFSAVPTNWIMSRIFILTIMIDLLMEISSHSTNEITTISKHGGHCARPFLVFRRSSLK